jgi:hypothetical protein
MPVFETPQPIFVTVDLGVGAASFHATLRTDTVVEVRPSDPANEADVKAAEQASVDYAGGRLLIKAPKQRGLFGSAGSIDVTVDLPSGSDVWGVAREGTFRATGRLGECRFKTTTGYVQLEDTGPLDLVTSIGNITVDRVEGPAKIATGSGMVRICELAGPGVIKNSNGDSWVGEAAEHLRLKVANGSITIDKAHGALEARTANGDIRIGEVVRGSVVLGVGLGQLEVGVGADSAVMLDACSVAGNVHNFMKASDGPGAFDETVEVYANVKMGDVTIRRA